MFGRVSCSRRHAQCDLPHCEFFTAGLGPFFALSADSDAFLVIRELKCHPEASQKSA